MPKFVSKEDLARARGEVVPHRKPEEVPAKKPPHRFQPGNKFGYKFDTALGDYLREYKYVDDCSSYDTGAVIVKNAYKFAVKSQLRVTNSVLADEDGADYATEMMGTETEDPTLTPEAVAAQCSTKANDYSLLAIRIDKPVGEPGSAATQETEGYGTTP